MRRLGNSRLLFAFLGVVWALGVLAGMLLLVDHETAPGIAADCPPEWPIDCTLRPTEGKANLVLFVHPHCPCTRATFDELARVVARTHGRLAVHVVFLLPEGETAGWERSDVWNKAAGIPGVAVVSDAGGIEARRFGAATSGQAVLYDCQGIRRFSGGVTGSRGHAGDNAGSAAVVAFVLRGEAALFETPVFGCPLFRPDPISSGSEPCCP